MLDKSWRSPRLMGEMWRETDIEQLYSEHAQALYAFLQNMTRNEEDTRDLLQDLFVKVSQKPSSLASARNIRAFLLKIAHNLALDLFRKRAAPGKNPSDPAVETEVFAQTDNPDETVFRHELARALCDLPPEQRAVVHLKLWECLTFDEIAETLGIPLNTAASRYRYGIDKLRHLLRPLYEEIK